jgi:glycosyltransferase involved in cell wall biosynthesis
MTIELILTGIAWAVAAFALLQTLIAIANYVFRADYSAFSNSNQHELVSVVIPVRNEESTIGNLLDDLIHQSYPLLEILVANDDSTDATAAVVREKQKLDPRIQLIDAGLKKEDWLGKNHACFSGSRIAKGRYLLFLDADVRLGANAIASTLSYLQQKKLVFMSVFPKQLLPSKEVYKVVPLMNYILLSLLPLFLVRISRFASLSAANGQFMLFDHELYKALEPHKRYRSEKVEDIHIARYIKRNNYRIACLTGNDDISCKMYDTYNDALEGFSKNVFAFFGNSTVAGLTFWFISFSGILWMAFLHWYMFLVYLTMVLVTRWLIARVSKQKAGINIRIHYVQLWTLGLLMIRALKHSKNKSYQWKGRTIA